jgi:hypothetical protein
MRNVITTRGEPTMIDRKILFYEKFSLIFKNKSKPQLLNY